MVGDGAAKQEKSLVALSSVLAAVGLTSFKVVVSIATGSLGIIAEAVHSALDLMAAFLTFLAVRISGKPADKEHPYGHGKVENLSALFETLLLLVTCVWIVYEAIHRLFFKAVHVDASFWAFLVMAVSVVVDFTRSRALMRAAKKYNSQALEADALHFSTDIWSSLVVILGLICIKIADWVSALAFLDKADAIAAIGVASIAFYVSIKLGVRTVQALLDTAPQGISDKIVEAVEAIPGLADCHNVRVRSSGPDLFVDAHVVMDGSLSLEKAHERTEAIERTIQEIIPSADVTVHPEPQRLPALDIANTKEKIIECVQALPGVIDCHHVQLHYTDARFFVEVHINMDGGQSLEEAHKYTEMVEDAIRHIVPDAEVTVHPEPIPVQGPPGNWQ
jgi:cation diffusion facilitator family transporter